MFVLLTVLEPEDPLVYVRTIGLALLHWQNFNTALPGLCYGEEFGEVMLSRLGYMKRKHTWAVAITDVEDLFVQISPAAINRRLLVSGVSSAIEAEVRQRLQAYLHDERVLIRYCPWTAVSSKTEQHWIRDPVFPPEPYDEPDTDEYKNLLRGILQSFLHQQKNFVPAVLRLMDNTVPLRSDADKTTNEDTIWTFRTT